MNTQTEIGPVRANGREFLIGHVSCNGKRKVPFVYLVDSTLYCQ